MNQKQVKFKIGPQVTATSPFSPPLDPGAFVFDSETLALYVDLLNRRVQVKDPLKLALTGGTITGDVCIVDQNGTTSSCFSANTGAITGRYLETTGDISIDSNEEIPNAYAVIDSNGRIRSITKEQMIQELGVVNPSSLGKMAYKDGIIIGVEKNLPAKVPENSEVLTFDTEFISAISTVTLVPAD